MTREKVLNIAEGVVFYSVVFTLLLVIVSTVGCEVTKEVVLDPNGVPSGVERVVVEGPGGEYSYRRTDCGILCGHRRLGLQE